MQDDIIMKLSKMYNGTITLTKEISSDCYFICLTPLQARISIRVNIESNIVFEGNYFKYYLL